MIIALMIALLVFIAIVVRRMQEQMMDCNNLLKVLPIECLENDMLETIKKFLVN
jgi:hypothetical protein